MQRQPAQQLLPQTYHAVLTQAIMVLSPAFLGETPKGALYNYI